jgi:hypothetical protein
MRVRSGGDASGPHARSDGVGGTGPAWARETQAQAWAFFFEHRNLQRRRPDAGLGPDIQAPLVLFPKAPNAPPPPLAEMQIICPILRLLPLKA